jgi:tetratricopeptide (TPR) repeat protein/tRNA A-37 threonylcarbamoyl transferase component Bud32
MLCPTCGANTAAGSSRCLACGARLRVTSSNIRSSPLLDGDSSGTLHDAPTLADEHTPRNGLPANVDGGSLPTGSAALVPGQQFGHRYRIIKVLGAGGMGIVYQAYDEELGVAIALKVIRSEPSMDPQAAQDLERRFKRELMLARQVTHTNVIRIHDLGDVDGVKYITMPNVQGPTLAAAIRQGGRLPMTTALSITRQIAAGLKAAHDAGVIHRDLKPANILIEGDHAIITDFGIAGSFAGSTAAGGGTMTGALLGTIEYMAPEQACGQKVDHRADIYAFGLILYDMLVGGRRPAGENAVADLMQRMKIPPPALRSIDPQIPERLESIVARCLDPNPSARYQSTAHLVRDLDRLDDTGRLRRRGVFPFSSGWARVSRTTPARRLTIGLLGLIAAVALAVGAAVFSGSLPFDRSTRRPLRHEPVSVLIADFDNRTGDPVFEESLEQALAIGLEGAPFVTSYSRRDARALAGQIQIGRRLDETTARLICQREGVKVLVAGMIQTTGRGYALEVRVTDPVPGKQLAAATMTARSKADVLGAVASLASRIRDALGDSAPETETLAAGETFTTGSLEAMHSYSQAQDLAASGKDEEAISNYRRAAEHDPRLGRAYAGWAISASRLGRKDESLELWKKSLALLNRMTEREKYRTLGGYYLDHVQNYEKAVENYETLVKLYPADRAGHSNLALSHFYLLNFTKALEEARHSVDMYPANIRFRNNLALYAMYAADFTAAADEARHVIQQNARFHQAYLPVAVSALAAGDLAAAARAYEQMKATGAPGSSLALAGLADLEMYRGRYSEAAATLERGVVGDAEARNQTARAKKLVALGEAYLSIGKTVQAVDAVQRGIGLARDRSVLLPAARTLIGAGRSPDARAIVDELSNHLQPHSRAAARIIEGDMALHARKPLQAVDAYRAARSLADLWLARLGLGIAYVEAGHHAEALSELETCRRRRGEAAAVFLDDVPSFRYLAPLHYWLGRAQEGLGIRTEAAANYTLYVQLRGDAHRDALVADARKRADALSQ